MPKFRGEDLPTLQALNFYRRAFERGEHWLEWCRPMDIGATSRSPHVAALARLVRLELAERRQRHDKGAGVLISSRASYEYRISSTGIAELARHAVVVGSGIRAAAEIEAENSLKVGRF
jgi:hypothetical protein